MYVVAQQILGRYLFNQRIFFLLVRVNQLASSQLQTLKILILLVKLKHKGCVVRRVEEDQAALFVLLVVVTKQDQILVDWHVYLLILLLSFVVIRILD